MARWLEFPTELGVAPQELDLLRTLRVASSEGAAVSYLFKFRHAAPHGGAWLVGVARAYPISGSPRLGGSDTFSRFVRLDEKSLDEHVRDFYDGT